MKNILILLAGTLFAGIVDAQEFTTENVMTLAGAESPEATIDDVAWIQGYWTGTIFQSEFEEIWSPPVNGTMMGSFKILQEDTVNFYELMVIRETGNSLTYLLKHFHSDLKGWEERDEVINWPLVKISETTAWFDGITFEKLDDDHLRIYLAVSFKDGSVKEFTSVYTRGSL